MLLRALPGLALTRETLLAPLTIEHIGVPICSRGAPTYPIADGCAILDRSFPWRAWWPASLTIEYIGVPICSRGAPTYPIADGCAILDRSFPWRAWWPASQTARVVVPLVIVLALWTRRALCSSTETGALLFHVVPLLAQVTTLEAVVQVIHSNELVGWAGQTANNSEATTKLQKGIKRW